MMMNSSTRAELERAYRLIKRDRIAEAEAIIRPILADEPENVHAWWLLAYAITNPAEIREALTNVITLDPDFSNAPKAREMLEKLDEQYPDEQVADDADVFAFSLEDDGDDEVNPFAEDPFADVFAEADSGDSEPFAVFDDLKEADDLFAFDTDDELEARNAHEELESLFDEPELSIEEEVQAEQEERAAQPRRRGLRLFGFVVLIAVVALVAVIVIMFGLGSDEDTPKDPGPLQVIDVQSGAVQTAQAEAEAELTAANLGSDSRVVVASSSLGDTLFVEFCSQPDPDLSQKIMDGMAIAARQAPAVENELAAVGVSIDLCTGSSHDTLYRAYVAAAAASSYDSGGYGTGDTGLAGFQAAWRTP